jgi:ribosomal protein S18 acetylase RimI-like enzyme
MANTPPLSMDDIIIRPATETDVNQIGILWKKLADYHQIRDARLPKPAQNGAILYAQRIESQLDDPYHHVLVAEAQGQIVGYVLGMIADYMADVFLPESTGFLADIFVDEAYRGAGVGKKLVSTLGLWFKSRGIGTMEWYVASENPAAQAFWQAVGGKELIIRMRLNL